VIEKFARAFAHGTDWVLKNKGDTEVGAGVSAYTKDRSRPAARHRASGL